MPPGAVAGRSTSVAFAPGMTCEEPPSPAKAGCSRKQAATNTARANVPSPRECSSNGLPGFLMRRLGRV
jgi:hypothetical protein